MRQAFLAALGDIAGRDPRIVLLTADLGFSLLESFRERFPARFFNVGVAEANMIGLCTGLAEDGFLPFAYTMAAFALPRTFEAVRNGPVLHRLPVRIVGVGAGFDYGVAGRTHYACDDVALARGLPDLEVVAPADDRQARRALATTFDRPGPVYYRLGNEGRGEVPGLDGAFEPGRAQLLSRGSDVTFVALGPCVHDALDAAKRLEARTVSAGVLLVASLRPAPVDDLVAAARGTRLLATVEAHSVEGGVGSWAAEVVAERALGCRLLRFGIRAADALPGSPAHLRKAHGLDGVSLADAVLRALDGA